MITVTGAILNKKLDLLSPIYANTPDLSLALTESVIKRSPVRTGAMIDDVIGDYYQSPNSENLLVRIYSGVENQLAEWNRVYVQYQEGGWTDRGNNEHEGHKMYERIGTDDLPLIEEWAMVQVNSAIGGWIS